MAVAVLTLPDGPDLAGGALQGSGSAGNRLALCALVISTPVTVVSGLAAGARRGILIKGGTYLEDARSWKAVAADKTGTITEGKPKVKWQVWCGR